MALIYQKQIRDLFFADDVVTELAKKGDVAINKVDSDTVPGFYISVMDGKNQVHSSNIADVRKVTDIRKTAPVKFVGQAVTYTMAVDPATIVGKTAMFSLRVTRRDHMDTAIIITAGREIQAGDTKKIVVEDIAQQLAGSLSRDERTHKTNEDETTVAGKTIGGNTYFTVTTTADSIVIKEKDDHWKGTFDLNNPDYSIEWRGEAHISDEFMHIKSFTQAVTTKGTLPVNQGFQMLLAERFLGSNSKEYNNFNPGYGLNGKLLADVDAEYTTVDISFYMISRDDPKHSDQMITVAFTDSAKADTFLASITELTSTKGPKGDKGDKGDPGA